MKKTILLALTHFIALICGAAIVFLWLGLEARKSLGESNAMLTQVAVVSRYASFVDVQRTNGTKKEYKEALLNFLTGIDEAAKQPSSFYDSKMYAGDKTLTYERLSRIEKESGNINKSEEYMKRAMENCSRTGWKDCSASNITLISKKLEDKRTK